MALMGEDQKDRKRLDRNSLEGKRVTRPLQRKEERDRRYEPVAIYFMPASLF
jgi:hypothetical protein